MPGADRAAQGIGLVRQPVTSNAVPINKGPAMRGLCCSRDVTLVKMGRTKIGDHIGEILNGYA